MLVIGGANKGGRFLRGGGKSGIQSRAGVVEEQMKRRSKMRAIGM